MRDEAKYSLTPHYVADQHDLDRRIRTRWSPDRRHNQLSTMINSMEDNWTCFAEPKTDCSYAKHCDVAQRAAMPVSVIEASLLVTHRLYQA